MPQNINVEDTNIFRMNSIEENKNNGNYKYIILFTHIQFSKHNRYKYVHQVFFSSITTSEFFCIFQMHNLGW